MCQQCFDAIRHHWPDLPRKDYGRLLFEATSYPAGDGEQVARQVAEMAEKSGQCLEAAMAIADRELDEAMAKARELHYD